MLLKNGSPRKGSVGRRPRLSSCCRRRSDSEHCTPANKINMKSDTTRPSQSVTASLLVSSTTSAVVLPQRPETSSPNAVFLSIHRLFVSRKIVSRNTPLSPLCVDPPTLGPSSQSHVKMQKKVSSSSKEERRFIFTLTITTTLLLFLLPFFFLPTMSLPCG
jgi:hypothetical protein